jgi:DNA-binding transcriptional MerR regulator
MSWEKSSRKLQVPAKRYRIGELVRYSPFSRQTIHNYTIMGLIREAEWTEGGHRLYDESVFSRLSRILELKESMSLTEIRRTFSEEERTEREQLCQAGELTRFGETRPYGRDNATQTKGDDFMSPETPQ